MTSTEPNAIQDIDELDVHMESLDSTTDLPQGSALAWLKGNVVVAVMAAVSVGVIGLLAVRFRPKAASAEEAQANDQFEATIAMLDMPSSVKDGKAGTMTQAFYCEGERRQIPMAALSGNPFVFQKPDPPAEATSQPANSIKGTTRRRSASENELRVKAMSAVRKLKLESVLMGPRGPMAMISSNLLSEGQILEGWTVSKIRPLAVVLTWRDQKHVLKIPE